MDPATEQKRKPRRTRGTPSYYYRNRVAYGTIAAGFALFGLWYITPFFRKFHDHMIKIVSTPNVEHYERRELFSLPAARTKKFIEDTLEQKKEFHNER